MIFMRYKNPILNFCLRILGNRPDAEDATGEVFLALFAKQYTFKPEAKFSTWLYTIARNNCIDRIRKKKNLVSRWFSSKSDDELIEWDVADTRDISSEMLAKKEMAKHVQLAIQMLPLEQKEAIILREYQSLSYEQIAQVLNCSLEKTRILIFRAREQLRNQLSSYIKES